MVPKSAPTKLGGPEHPSREALRRVLERPGDQSAWDKLAAAYEAMATIWTDWAAGEAEYVDPVRAALPHTRPASWVLEVSCGTGQASEVLDGHAGAVLATDVNRSMLTDAPTLPHTTYAVADVRALPVRSGCVPLLVGLNAVPHIAEFTRVLAADGQLLWCTSFGPDTPLYIPPDELLGLFGPGFLGAAGRAGHGEWLLLTRDT